MKIIDMRNDNRGIVLTGAVFMIVLAGFLFWLWWQKPRYPMSTIGVESYQFRYIELIKGEPERGKELPMLIALHGYGDNANNFARVLDGIDFPVRLIVPEAYYGKKSWYPLENQLRGIPIEGRKLQSFIIAIIKKYEPAGKPVLYGFSQGGNLALYLTLWDPVRFSYVVIEGACLPESLHPEIRRLDVAYPTISQHHGANDMIYDISQVRREFSNIHRLGLPITLKAWPTNHKCFYPDRMNILFDELKEACASAAQK